MNLNKIDHIGIAVKSLEDALKLYTDVLGLNVSAIEVIEEQKVRTAIINIGESKIELLESTSPESPVASFIEKKGEGLHHIALGVDNIQKALQTLKEQGIPLIDEKPRKGVQNTKIAFIHPKGAKILLELTESQS
jgi:methylmalonyl-CoA epimerase